MGLSIVTSANKIVDTSNNNLKIDAIYANVLKYSYIEESKAINSHIYTWNI